MGEATGALNDLYTKAKMLVGVVSLILALVIGAVLAWDTILDLPKVDASNVIAFAILGYVLTH